MKLLDGAMEEAEGDVGIELKRQPWTFMKPRK
jgi:hypothetical protein